MKTLTLTIVLAGCVFGSSGYMIKVPTTPATLIPEALAPMGWVHYQKLLLPLFENVCEVSDNPTIRQLAQEFTPDAEDYTKPEVLTNLGNLDLTNFLSKGEIFTEYNSYHMNELKIIYEVLYYAKNFDAFYKAAAWARQNINCGLFVNAIYLAMQNRNDTQELTIPAPYELLPNYFIGMDVIIKTSSILSGRNVTPSGNIRDEGNEYVMDANYTANFYDNDDDSKLAYFREDVGLNSFYFLRKLKLAPWFNEDVNSRYGENVYQMMKQLMARYNLERYANGMPEISSLNWNALPDIPYDPMLIYSNGNEFAHRTSHINLQDNETMSLLQSIENNIVSVVSQMMESGYNKTQILNHVMVILVAGDRSYETLARQLLGKDLNYNGQPSVLEHYMTSLRDPMFWIINKKIVDIVDSALKVLPPYSKNELFFPGVEILNIDVKKAMTVYDYFEFDVTDALKINDTNSAFKVKIGQPRLNHKPLTIKLTISSLVSSKGLVKLFLGPKLMPGEIENKKNLFTLYEVFEVDLKKGINIISKTLDDAELYSQDFMSLTTIRKKINDAEFGIDPMPVQTVETQTGYPSRLTLPKGTPTGLPLQLFAFVAPIYKANLGGLSSPYNMEFNNVILSPGYPLDLEAEDNLLFKLPNGIIKYITVTHKGDNKVENYGGAGVTNKWYGSTYDPASQPDYSAKAGKSLDYTAKKEQFGKKEDFAAKIDHSVYDQDYLNEENQSQNYYSSGPRLLSSSPLDYASKSERKEPFDYKVNKSQFDKKDYTSKKGVNNKNRIFTTTEPSTIIVTIDTNAIKTDANKEKSEINNISESVILNPQPEIDYDSDKYDVSPAATTKRIPTVYDFILHGFDYDDVKVYE